MRTTSSLFLFLVVLIVASAAVPKSGEAREAKTGALNKQEIQFVMRCCSDLSSVADDGMVIAFGNIIRPPILITQNRGAILINGIQVFPTPEKPADFTVHRRLDDLREYYHGRKATKGEERVSQLRHKLNGMKDRKQVDDFKVEKGKGVGMRVVIGGREYKKSLEGCAPSAREKNTFIVNAVLREYADRRAEVGKEAALDWLRGSFDDLVQLGVLGQYKISAREETAQVKYSCEQFELTYGFYPPQTPPAIAYEKEWRAKEPEMLKMRETIRESLASGNMLLYSFSRDAKAKLVPELVTASEDFRDGKNTMRAMQVLRTHFELTAPDEQALEEEFQ